LDGKQILTNIFKKILGISLNAVKLYPSIGLTTAELVVGGKKFKLFLIAGYHEDKIAEEIIKDLLEILKLYYHFNIEKFS